MHRDSRGFGSRNSDTNQRGLLHLVTYGIPLWITRKADAGLNEYLVGADKGHPAYGRATDGDAARKARSLYPCSGEAFRAVSIEAETLPSLTGSRNYAFWWHRCARHSEKCERLCKIESRIQSHGSMLRLRSCAHPAVQRPPPRRVLLPLRRAHATRTQRAASRASTRPIVAPTLPRRLYAALPPAVPESSNGKVATSNDDEDYDGDNEVSPHAIEKLVEPGKEVVPEKALSGIWVNSVYPFGSLLDDLRAIFRPLGWVAGSHRQQDVEEHILTLL